jgi:hypothetical protein
LQLLSVELVQRLATMPFKKPAENIVKQFSRVDRLQVECGFAARFETQHSLRIETIRTIAVDAEAARTVNKLRTELVVQ